MYRFVFRLLFCVVLVLAAVTARAEPATILVFGDSLSAGYGLPQGKSWVDLLQQRLGREGYDYRVVNASISGETTTGGRNRLAGALSQYRPQLVILELGVNDALRGQSLRTVQDNLVRLVRACQAAGAKVLLVGMRIPPNYGPEYTKKFQAVFADVARQTRVALAPFLFKGFADKREFFQSDGIHPGIEAQSLMLDNVWVALKPTLAGASAKN